MRDNDGYLNGLGYTMIGVIIVAVIMAIVGYADRKTINVSVYGRKGQKTKKLCTLCNDCYYNLLDYLGVCDVDFGEMN